MKPEMLQRLKEYESNLKILRNRIAKLEKRIVSRKELMTSAEELSRAWFDQFENQLRTLFKIQDVTLEKYRNYFDKLMKLSRPNNLRSSYLDGLNKICKRFKDDLIIPVQQYSHQVISQLDLVNIIQGIPNLNEQEYLKESIECANHGFLRASIVMGWCAVMDHIHRKIEKLGFQIFNQTSVVMKNSTSGRFKKFSKLYSVGSLSELREVFDRDILWILEGMELIDSNENKRLQNCFDIRSSCAHPGEAPITRPNLLSFFSDISEIVLKNPKFSL